MTNDEAMTAMTLDMERRGLMPSSIIKREIHLRALVRWLHEETTLLGVTREQINLFLDSRAIGPRTRYTWLANLHAFYKFAVAEGLITEDPTEKIVRPKLRRSLPRPASREDLERLLGLADPQQLCWLLLAGLQGLRCKELAGLRREDVFEADGMLRVLGKGDHERMLPLNALVVAALEALPMPRVGWMFTRVRGGPFSANWMSACFNRFLHENDVPATAHQLRHWFGSKLWDETHDLRLCQEMLGHRDPATTAIYTAFSRPEAKRAISSLTFAANDEDKPKEAA